MPLEQRIHKIQAAGAGFVFVQAFTRAYAQQKAADFVPGLARVFPYLRSIHVGANFRFGAGRSGDINILGTTAAAAGIGLHVLPRENLDGMAISSSRIRLALMEGSLHEVNAMLGHPYLIEGRVQPGKGLGRQLDYPTLNLAWMPEVLPRFGVYRVMVQGPQMDRPAPGVANYGVRPTVDKATEPLLEVHVLQADRIPSQGDRIKVALLDFIRPEMTFPSVRDLHQQIARDVAAAREAGLRAGAPTPLPF
jgi:riboflavin kinase/FMN adenylyltransferase